MNKIFAIVLLLLISSACQNDIPDVITPDPGNNSLLSETLPIPEYSRVLIEGIYEVVEGKNSFGKQIAIEWNGEYLSMMTGKNGAYLVFESGQLDSVLIFEGYWRYSQGSETGMASLHVKRNEGGRQILNGTTADSIIFRGLYGKETSKPETPLVLKYKSPLPATTDGFITIGHRGGGRNVDRLGASENSVEIIRMADRLGCDGIEIDIKMTRDKVPVLFHDEFLSTRLIRENYMIGKISEFPLKTLQSFCTLINGERIPTLRQALDAVLYDTELKLVWLDIKQEGIIEHIAPIQMEYMSEAAGAGRELLILLGLPTEEIYEEYICFDPEGKYPALCEISSEKTKKGNCMVWAPRWSETVSEADADNMRATGRKVYTWTLDEPDFIEKFVKDGLFDAILTNYPMIVKYERYIQNEK